MSVPASDVLAYCDELLSAHDYDDLGPNGLQVHGGRPVEHVATGVSATRETLQRAADAGADLVLVHHGVLWDSDSRALEPLTAGRVKVLLEHDMTLGMYHLCIDGHMQLGNNAIIAERLGAETTVPFGSWRSRTIGVEATFPGDGVTIDELLERVQVTTDREPFAWRSGPDRIRRVGILSGCGAMEGTPWMREAAERGLDAYLTGEATEHTMGEAAERGLHFIAAGHYATETFGIRALGDHVAERFGLRHTFVDVPNPI